MTTRDPPNAPPPQAVAIVSRVYRKSLRPIVLITCGLAAMWSFFGAIGGFRVFSFQNSRGLSHLAPLSLALGAVYAAIFVTQIFGLMAAQSQKPKLIKTYSLMAVIAGLAIVATGLIEVVGHFLFKKDLISACTAAVDGDLVYYGWGFWGPTRSERLDRVGAQSFCNRAWDRDSVSTVVSLLILAFYGGVLAVIARAYVHQTRDPNFGRTVETTATYPVHYAPPYVGSGGAGGYPQQGYPQQGYQPGYQQPGTFAPPQGPPPPGGSGGPNFPVPNGGFAGPAGPPPSDLGYGVGFGAGAGGSSNSKDPFADTKPDGKADPKDDPFADFERIPDHERDIVATRPAPGGKDRFDV